MHTADQHTSQIIVLHIDCIAKR